MKVAQKGRKVPSRAMPLVMAAGGGTHVAGGLDRRVVRAGQIRGAADQEGRQLVDALDHGAGVLAGGVGPALEAFCQTLRQVRRRLVAAGGIPAFGELRMRRAPGRQASVRLGALGALGLAALGQVARHIGRHQELGLEGDSQVLLGGAHLLGAEGAPVHLGETRPVGAAEADGGPGDQDRRALGLGAGRLEGPPQAVHVLPVDSLDVPALRLEARPHVLAEGDGGGPVDGHPVVVVENDQVTEAQMSGDRGGLVADAFHQVAIAGKGVDPVVTGSLAFAGEARLGHPGGQGHADGVGEALPQRTRGHLDTGGIPALRVSGGEGAQLPERLDVFQREIEAEQVEQRVEQHRRVAGGEHEAIAERPGGIARIEAQMVVPEQKGRSRQPHRRAQVADPGALHRVDGEAADGVLDLLAQRGGQL
jgi:hypothetical protein